MDKETCSQEEIILRSLVMLLEWLGNQVQDLQERVERLEARDAHHKAYGGNQCHYPS